MYFYNGIQRIQLFFHSPNTCAVFINFIIIALIVFFNYYHYHNNDNNKKNIIRYSSVLMILGFMTLSASTFSRGGTIALIVSLLLYSWFTRKSSSLWFICIFIIINILFPEGSARLNSIFQISGDKSIIHRFLIWEGTAGTLLEHPWIGVGLANVGRYYSAWHQPLELHERYHSAIGDLSTIGSAYGFLILFLTCYSICFIFTYIVFSKKNLSLRNVEIVGAAVTFFCNYLVASLFSTLFTEPLLLLPAILSILCSFILTYMDNKLSFRLLKNSLLLSFLLCLGITTIIFSIGTLHNQSLGYTKKEIVFTSDTAYFLFPPEASATLVFVHQHPINNTQTENNFLSENMINIIRKELRPAAQKGFNAVYTPLYFFNSVMEHLSSQNTRSGKIIVLPDTPSTAELISNPNLIKTQYEITISYLNPASAHFTETHYATNAIPRNIFLFQNSNVIDEVFFHSLATTHQAVNVFTINENNHFDERIKIISENFELF